jgi:hypothetical protein
MGWDENAFLWEAGRVQKMKLEHADLDTKELNARVIADGK